jgi:hypothetical protein
METKTPGGRVDDRTRDATGKRGSLLSTEGGNSGNGCSHTHILGISERTFCSWSCNSCQGAVAAIPSGFVKPDIFMRSRRTLREHASDTSQRQPLGESSLHVIQPV